jgi:hypothetical protein
MTPKDGTPWHDRVAARSLLSFSWRRPVRRAASVRVPFLLVVPEADSIAPVPAALEVARKAPGAELFRSAGGHYDVYEGGASFADVLRTEVDFLHCPEGPPSEFRRAVWALMCEWQLSFGANKRFHAMLRVRFREVRASDCSDCWCEGCLGCGVQARTHRPYRRRRGPLVKLAPLRFLSTLTIDRQGPSFTDSNRDSRVELSCINQKRRGF